MNEEIEKYFKLILKSIEDWEDEKTLDVAKRLNLQLTLLKLLVRPSEFDSLDAFSRYLRETTKFINDAEAKQVKGR